ncbi:MAG: alpha/beta fold hydrolase [Geminicoccaceae bacterium]
MTRETLVLLPGLLCDRRLWAHQIEALKDRVEIVVADLTRDDTTEAMARRVLAEVPERFALAGLSMGGYVAQQMVRLAPERVTRLALIDTRARPDTEESKARRRNLIELARTGRFAEVAPMLIQVLLAERHRMDQRLEDTIVAMGATVGPEAFERQQHAIMGHPDHREDLKSVRCPTLVLCGREDAITPITLHEEMAAALPNATLVVVPGAGHLAPMESPDAVSRQMAAWLQA